MKQILKSILERLPLVLFGLTLGASLVGYGYLVGSRHMFPYASVKRAEWAAASFWQWAELRLPFRRPEDHPHVILWNKPEQRPLVSDRASHDLTFITAYRPGGFAFLLVDAQGNMRYQWHIPDAAMERLQRGAWSVPASHNEVMGAHLFANGDVVFNFNYKALVRIDSCSNLTWYLKQNTHHSIFVDDDGFIWVPSRRRNKVARPSLPHVMPPFWEDLILKVSPDGHVAEEVSILEAMYQSGYQGLLLQGANDWPRTVLGDPTHLNDIELVSAGFARHNSFAKEGDILISMRTIDAIAIIDRDSHRVEYALNGAFLRQHDPDLLDNGNILVFDNRTETGQHNEARYLVKKQAFGYSRLLEINPRTQQIEWSFQGSTESPFYSSIQGTEELLDNGTVLVVEPEGGRVFEVGRSSHQIVWQFRNQIGETDRGALLGRITGADRHRASDLSFLDAGCD